jgi:hypothetical protein
VSDSESMLGFSLVVYNGTLDHIEATVPPDCLCIQVTLIILVALSKHLIRYINHTDCIVMLLSCGSCRGDTGCIGGTGT